MNAEFHKKSLKESFDTLRDCINRGVELRQKVIGFLCSSACSELIELHLHKLNLINPGANIKHNWFASKNKALNHIVPEFPNKDRILNIAKEIEEKRNLLCYGKPQPIKTVEDALRLLNELKTILKEEESDYEL